MLTSQRHAAFGIGTAVTFHDGIERDGKFIPSANSLAPHRYEGQSGVIIALERDNGRNLYTVQFSDGGTVSCHASHLGGEVEEHVTVSDGFRERFETWCKGASALIQRWEAEGMSQEQALERFWGKDLIRKWKQFF